MRALTIDGKTLEGGGQLVRIILALSALTRRPVFINNVRANRGNQVSGQGGGLKRQHLIAAKWLAETCDARTEGLELGNRELLFQPSGKPPDLQRQLHGEVRELPDGRKARAVTISLESQGAMALLLQAVLPYMILTGCTPTSEESASPILLTLRGGTHVTSAPTVCYITNVLIPNLKLMFGDERPLIDVSSVGTPRNGWSFGSRELGSASFIINPLPAGASLPCFTLKRRGAMKRLHLTLLAPADYLNELRYKALDTIQEEMWDVEEVVIDKAEASGQRQRYYILMVAEMENGCRLGSDCLWSGAVGRGGFTPEKVALHIVKIALKSLKRELATGMPLDHHMLDQVAVFMGLANGVCRLKPKDSDDWDGETFINDRDASMHTQTARWAVHKLLGARFEEDGTCHGVGFEAGTQTWHPLKDTEDMLEAYHLVEQSIENEQP